MKKYLIGAIVLVLIVAGAFYLDLSKNGKNLNQEPVAVSITSPVSGSSYQAGETITIKWTPANFQVIEIALVPENIKKADGLTNKAVSSVYGGEIERVAPITTGEYKFTLPKQILDDKLNSSGQSPEV